MRISYDILIDDAKKQRIECIENGFESKVGALRRLRKERKRYPEAYLVKVVETRCREPRPKKGR